MLFVEHQQVACRGGGGGGGGGVMGRPCSQKGLAGNKLKLVQISDKD